MVDSDARVETAAGAAVAGVDTGTPLVVHFGALGDMVMLVPALRELLRRWGTPVDVVGIRGAPELVLRGLDCVGETRSVRSRRRSYWLAPDQRKLVRWLRSRRAGPTWLFDPRPEAARLLARGGVEPERCTFGRDLIRGDLEHGISYSLRLLRCTPRVFGGAEGVAQPIDLADPRFRPGLEVTAAEQTDARRWLERRGFGDSPLVLFQTRSRNWLRGWWPTDRWVEVIRAVLTDLPHARVLLLGSPAERSWNRRLRAECRSDRVVDTSAELPLRRLIALLPSAHSCVSLDSGPAHLAAVRGCPLVVLLSKADPRRNHPVGPAPTELVACWPRDRWPATRREWEETHRIEEIAPEAVVAAWRRVTG